MEKIKVSDIRPNPNNPRIIKDEKFKKLVKSIQEFPQMLELRPIVVNDDMIALGGNMRLKALEHLGIEETFIIRASELTKKQEAEFIIKDNVGYGEWNWDQLANEWDVEDLDDWGLDLPLDFAKELEAEDDNFEEPESVETDIVLGDLFEIGEHRLLCGDSSLVINFIGFIVGCKPLSLPMQISSNKNSLVVDFFLGSGSTMVASHQLKRKCYGMELEPKYCQVIIDRMRKLDPAIVIKRNGITQQ